MVDQCAKCNTAWRSLILAILVLFFLFFLDFSVCFSLSLEFAWTFCSILYRLLIWIGKQFIWCSNLRHIIRRDKTRCVRYNWSHTVVRMLFVYFTFNHLTFNRLIIVQRFNVSASSFIIFSARNFVEFNAISIFISFFKALYWVCVPFLKQNKKE